MTYAWTVDSAPSGSAGGGSGSDTRSASRSPSSRVVLTTPTENGELQLHKRTFTPDAIGDYVFRLTVTDPGDLSHSDTVKVKVLREAENLLPANITATAAARSVDVSWDELPIATGYEVEIGMPASAGGLGHTSHTTTGTSITVSSLTPQKTYEYRVRMTNSDGVGPWTAWATVVTPGETPPTPTADQWNVQYLNNKIQVKVTEIPSVIPAISQVKAKLGISPLGTGLGSDTITVTKAIGTALNQWVDVLTSADTDWQTGTWTAQIRFENTIGDPVYSLGKLVTVPSPNHPPKAFAGYNDIVLPNTTVYLRGSSKDPDRHLATEMAYNWSLVEDVTETPGRSTTRVPQVTPLITIASPTSKRTSFTAPAQAQTLRIRLTVTDPNGATDTDDVITQVHSGVGTTEWLDTRATRGCGATRDKEQMRRIDRRPHGEYRWAADPEDEVWSAWEDTDQTRNRNEGDWTDTDPLETMGTPPDVEKKQTRTITWEQEQTRTSETCGTIEPQWLEASETETRWVPVTPPPPVIPPTPTNDQWDIEYDSDSNKIQAKVISLPDVISAISEARVHMETGQPPNLVTVTKAIGVSLDTWVDVLTSADTEWLAGTWTAQIRFENSAGNSRYSLPGKPVIVPAVPPPPPPPPRLRRPRLWFSPNPPMTSGMSDVQRTASMQM